MFKLIPISVIYYNILRVYCHQCSFMRSRAWRRFDGVENEKTKNRVNFRRGESAICQGVKHECLARSSCNLYLSLGTCVKSDSRGRRNVAGDVERVFILMYDTWRMTAVIYQLPNSSPKPRKMEMSSARYVFLRNTQHPFLVCFFSPFLPRVIPRNAK